MAMFCQLLFTSSELLNKMQIKMCKYYSDANILLFVHTDNMVNFGELFVTDISANISRFCKTSTFLSSKRK